MSRLSHQVFFQLGDSSEAKIAQLIAACKHFLTGHDGTLEFEVGRRDAELDRPVNDTDYDVSLHLVFRNRAAHDAYQTAPRHLEFVAQEKGNWKLVRVFDSLLEP